MFYILSIVCCCFAVVAGVAALCAMAISDYRSRIRKGLKCEHHEDRKMQNGLKAERLDYFVPLNLP